MKTNFYSRTKVSFLTNGLVVILLVLLGFTACEVEEPIPTYTLTTTSSPAEGGKITISPQVPNHPEGSQVTLTPEPNENWVFKQWEGDATGSTTPLQITMTTNKTITGVFVKRDYPLNIKIEGEGTVEEKIVTNPSGREYPHGTTVELTPKPKEGWEFAGWEGDLTGKESPKRITVDKQKNVTAKFKEALIFLSIGKITISSTKFSPNAVAGMMSNVSAAFVYKDSKGDIFAFHPGFAIEGDFSSLETVPAVTSQILKKENGVWVRFKEDDKALFWGARNFKIIGDRVVVSDANEIGSSPQRWRGNILYGKIQTGGNIDWVTANKPEEMGYFHGVSMGDLNKDGLLDVGGTPGIFTGNGINLFFQQPNGTFKLNDNLINQHTNGAYYTPFSLEFEDVFGDQRSEIITANYGGNSIPGIDDHQLRIFGFDEQTGKFELKFKGNYPNAHTWGLGATSIKVFDVNKDGIKDISIAREGGNAAGQLTAFEVWVGKSDGTFMHSFSSPTWTEKEMQFREFQIMDANNDGLDDIILIPFHYGSLFRSNPPCGPGTCEGIRLNHLIWLNKGDGTFAYYDKAPLVFPEVNVHYVLPYKVGRFIHFVGTGHIWEIPNSVEHNIWDIRLNLD